MEEMFDYKMEEQANLYDDLDLVNMNQSEYHQYVTAERMDKTFILTIKEMAHLWNISHVIMLVCN